MNDLRWLYTAGHAARAIGDYGRLCRLARRYAVDAHEPLHCRLLELADACERDLPHAALLWDRIEHRAAA